MEELGLAKTAPCFAPAPGIEAAKQVEANMDADTHAKVDLIAGLIADGFTDQLKAVLASYAVAGNREVTKYRKELEAEQAALEARYAAYNAAQEEIDAIIQEIVAVRKDIGYLEDGKERNLNGICKALLARRNTFAAAKAQHEALKKRLEALPADSPERPELQKRLDSVRPLMAEWNRLHLKWKDADSEYARLRQAADAAVRKHADEFGSRNVRSPYESIRVDKSGIQNKLNAVRGTLAELNTEDYTIRGQQREYADFAEKFHSALAKSIGGALENAIAKHHSTVRINGPGAMHSNESGKLVDFIEERIFNRVQGKFRPAVFLEKAKDAQTTILPDGTSIRFLDCSALDVDDFVKLAQSYVASVIMSLSSDWQKLNKKMKNGPAPDPVEYMTTREKEREFQLIRNDALARISRLTVDAIRAATATFGGRYAAACLAAFLNATNGDSPLGVLKPDEAADLVENALSNGVREFYYPPSSNCIKRLKDAAVSAAGGAKMVGSKYRALFGMVAVAYATAPVYARLVAPFEAEEKAMLRREAEYENNSEMQSRIRSIAKAWESNANCARDLAEEYESMISSGRFRDIADFPKIDIKKYKKSNDASRIAAKILRREARLSRIARRLAGIGMEKRIDFLTKGKAAPDGSAKVNPNPMPYAPFVAARRKRK